MAIIEPLNSGNRTRVDMEYQESEELHKPWRGATSTLETDSEKRKGIPVHSGFNQYFPDAIAEVAKLSRDSNEKHNPGEPLHWSRDKSDDHADCLSRHQLEAGTRDTDGHLHSTKVAWRAMAQLQLEIENGRRD